MKFDLREIDWFVVGISGGKDSTALLLWLKKEFFPSQQIPESKLICTFTDTAWEAPETYAHVKKISKELHEVIYLSSGETFLELAARKKRFPSTKARFCTTELKLRPAKDFMNTLSARVLSVNGIRAEESESRKHKTEFASALETYHGNPEWRPLITWLIEDVWLIHRKYEFPRNPLYDLGFERVGCMPCIMSRKSEIRLLERYFPERLSRQFERRNKKAKLKTVDIAVYLRVIRFLNVTAQKP